MDELFEARFWKKEKTAVRCNACNRNCLIPENSTGFCRVRKNIEGKLYSLVYGRTLTLSVDPIEKKPLFHFHPGSSCMGVSTYGCNFSCLHCQNDHISQRFTEQLISGTPFTSPKEIVEKALEEGVQGLAFTYTEPTIFIEYALETMKQAKKHGLYNVFVSNGFMSQEVRESLIGLLDAINIDLKGNNSFYKEVCGNALIEPVKDSIRFFHSKGVHTEVTNLVIPGFNDKETDFREASEFIFSLSEEMPLHFTRFFPMNKMDYLPSTPKQKLFRAKEIAEKVGLKYVYAGNLSEEENTYCKKCKNLLVKRVFYSTELVGLKGKNCSKCGAENHFVF